jgi:hypothetical protein
MLETIAGTILAVLLIAAALVTIAWAAGLFDKLR